MQNLIVFIFPCQQQSSHPQLISFFLFGFDHVLLSGLDVRAKRRPGAKLTPLNSHNSSTIKSFTVAMVIGLWEDQKSLDFLKYD